MKEGNLGPVINYGDGGATIKVLIIFINGKFSGPKLFHIPPRQGKTFSDPLKGRKLFASPSASLITERGGGHVKFYPNEKGGQKMF